jgi:hypothetical protein
VNSIPKWSTSELVVRYMLEPDIADVFVEGPFDKGLLNYFIESEGASGGVVYTIEVVDVEGAEGGNKGRLIKLAEKIAQEVDNADERVMCVVDVDLDRVLGRCEKITCLQYTDWSCMTCYLLNQEAFQKMDRLMFLGREVLGGAGGDWILATCRRLFAARVARAMLGIDAAFINVVSYAELRRGHFCFDLEKFIERWLIARGFSGLRSTFEEKLWSVDEKLQGDVRAYVCDEDFFPLAAWVARQAGLRGQQYSEEVLRRTLAVAVEARWLEGEQLFRRVVDFVS